MSDFDFVRYSKKHKKKKKRFNKKRKKGNLKKIKGYVPALVGHVDCSDMFKLKGSSLIVQYAYNRETGDDMSFDVRMFNGSRKPKKKRKPNQFNTMTIFVDGGKVGVKRMINFLVKNEKKFLQVRRGIKGMMKAREK